MPPGERVFTTWEETSALRSWYRSTSAKRNHPKDNYPCPLRPCGLLTGLANASIRQNNNVHGKDKRNGQGTFRQHTNVLDAEACFTSGAFHFKHLSAVNGKTGRLNPGSSFYPDLVPYGCIQGEKAGAKSNL